MDPYQLLGLRLTGSGSRLGPGTLNGQKNETVSNPYDIERNMDPDLKPDPKDRIHPVRLQSSSFEPAALMVGVGNIYVGL